MVTGRRRTWGGAAAASVAALIALASPVSWGAVAAAPALVVPPDEPRTPAATPAPPAAAPAPRPAPASTAAAPAAPAPQGAAAPIAPPPVAAPEAPPAPAPAPPEPAASLSPVPPATGPGTAPPPRRHPTVAIAREAPLVRWVVLPAFAAALAFLIVALVRLARWPWRMAATARLAMSAPVEMVGAATPAIVLGAAAQRLPAAVQRDLVELAALLEEEDIGAP